MRKRRGMTLIETLVALFLFALFGLAAAASLNLAMRQWGVVATRVNATQSARFLSGLIVNEIRQGLPNHHPTLGYQGAGLSATALLLPNTNTQQSSELIFTEPNSNSYNPLSAAWNPQAPQHYKRVRYFVRAGNTEVVREETSYSSAGIPTTTEEVVGRGDFLSLQFDWQSSNLVDVTVRAREGDTSQYHKDVSYVSRCYLLGR
ncbi:MAG: prepilin-type N-terminal cleavage/methylation domain-containing protein [Armatimonadetes bacterium]|nr:prepilin-type N-terminal cleavage/methylation domain-containing protein [Armatimonadota bacterium]